ncbi:MAG: periplasmic heavy metal sensor [Pseudomonadota bacterium]
MMNSRTLLIIAAISVGINLLLIGAFAGAALRPDPPPPPQSSGPSGAPANGSERAVARALIAATPEADRRAVRQDLRRSWRETAPLRRRIAEARKEIAAAIRSEPYDEARAIAAIEALAEAEGELRTTIQSDLMRRLDDVSPETRERIAEGMERRGQRRNQRQGERQRQRFNREP